MWETDWVDLFREARPRGILFLIDHTNVHQHKDALNFVLQMIDDEPAARKSLRMFMLLVNKSDLWSGSRTLEELLGDYRNETRRLKSQAERLGYRYAIASASLITGAGVSSALTQFFNGIRPRPRRQPAAPPPPGP